VDAQRKDVAFRVGRASHAYRRPCL
jgi:hypothetical protein